MHRNTRKLIVMAGAAMLLLVAGEVFARYYLGLGTPPLTRQDPQIEYLLQPNQDVYRFGNRFVTNAFGMRSDAFKLEREGAELRMMVFGDSVINGGNSLHQDNLATSLVQKELTALTGREVITGNISAGSWGPGNWLAYARKFGFFDADIVVLVISSHDYADVPAFTPLNRYHQPTDAPISALTEALDRFAIRFLKRISGNEAMQQVDQHSVPSNDQILSAMKDLEMFLSLAKRNAKHVLVFQHWERKEIASGEAKPGNQLIRQLVESIGLTAIQLDPYFRESLSNAERPFNDNIHPAQKGQQLIATAILDNLPDNAL